jgi:uptake hydrogenase large subunit
MRARREDREFVAVSVDDIAGAIRVRIHRQGAAIGAVDIVSTRPRDAARVFAGKSVGEMCATIGQVFSLCGTAQTVAALRASEQALGLDPVPQVEAARDLAVLAEMLTQTAMRLGLHWPRVLGLELQPALVRACLATERQIEAGALGAGWRVPGAGVGVPDAGLGEALSALDTLIEAADPGARLAKALTARGLNDYGALPPGRAAEAGALARCWEAPRVASARAAHGVGLAARLAAGRAELDDLPLQMIAALGRIAPAGPRSAPRQDGQGAATVETARGPLTHSVTISDGVVTACRTAAPTEANFTADGPVAAGLGDAAPDPVAAELHVLAVDPCVGCTVEIVDG